MPTLVKRCKFSLIPYFLVSSSEGIQNSKICFDEELLSMRIEQLVWKIKSRIFVNWNLKKRFEKHFQT